MPIIPTAGVPWGTLSFISDRKTSNRQVIYPPKLKHDADCAPGCHCRLLKRLWEEEQRKA